MLVALTIIILSTIKASFRLSGRGCALSSVSFCLLSALISRQEKEVEGGGGRGGVLLIREPKECSILIKKPGCWAWVKNRNQRRLASISAGVDGPIDSSTAASGCWAIEGIRQTAYDEMRWEDNFWQALHPPPISNHPVSMYTQTCTHGEKK